MEPFGDDLGSAAFSSGKYEVVARLGRGGMAQVFLALARGLGGFNKIVVIKRLDSDEPAYRRMFLDEARIAALLSHPNVVHTYEVFEHRGSYFITMEYLDGQPLNKVVRFAQGTGYLLDPRLCARVIAEALAGLHYAHELRDYTGALLNVVHRDVSPHNLFVTHDGQVKVFDFGVAKSVSRLEGTDTGVLKGKLGYMSPEQAAGGDVDGRGDVFSAGVVLWELLTLEHLVTRESPVAALREVLRGPSGALPAVLPIAAELRSIVSKSLARDRARRYQTAQEMRDALLAYLARNPFTHEHLAQFMQEQFASAREELQDRIQAAILPKKLADPVISVSEADAGGSSLLFDGADDLLPILDSGSYSLHDRFEATQSLSPASIPPVAAPMNSHSLPAAPSRPALPPVASRRGLIAAALLVATLGVWQLVRRPAQPAPELARTSTTPAKPAQPQVLLRLHGSNTIGGELGPALAEAYLRWRAFESVQRGPGKTSESSVISGKPGPDGARQSIEIEAEGSATAFSDLAAHTCDVGMASRPIKPAEADAVAQKGLGDLRTPAGEHVLGLDGIAVIVHPNNPLRSVDLGQLRRLFTGEVSEFANLTGSVKGVSVYARDDKSGTYDTFKHLVLGERALAPNVKRFMDSAALSDAVARDPQAIGFIGIAYVRSAKAIAVGEPGSLPLFPSAFTVATEDYALSRRLYLYLPVQGATPAAVDFVNFALSLDGQRVVSAAGFVDLSVQAIEARPCDGRCSPRYAALTKGARRLSLDFRFTSGRAELDNRALRDLDRLILFLRGTADAKLMLLGFSDARGSAQQNLSLARERAKKVDEELSARGVHAAVVDALGQDMPVSSNDSDAGREKNRRVEVWLR